MFAESKLKSILSEIDENAILRAKVEGILFLKVSSFKLILHLWWFLIEKKSLKTDLQKIKKRSAKIEKLMFSFVDSLEKTISWRSLKVNFF